MVLELARAPVLSDQMACDGCVVHMSNLDTLQSKYAYLIDQLDEVESWKVS
jgi:hypothetical protein